MIYAKTFTRFVQTKPLGGRLFGTTKVAGLPDAPVRCRVQLVSAENPGGTIFPINNFVNWIYSDENGNWEFRNLDPAIKYHAIAYDHTGQYDPVVKMNLIPTVD